MQILPYSNEEKQDQRTMIVDVTAVVDAMIYMKVHLKFN